MQQWAYVMLAVATGLAANLASALWAAGGRQSLGLLVVTLVCAPLTFLGFGLAASRTGAAAAAALIDALLAILTVAFALAVLGEWRRVTTTQLVGMGLAVAGVCLLARPGRTIE